MTDLSKRLMLKWASLAPGFWMHRYSSKPAPVYPSAKNQSTPGDGVPMTQWPPVQFTTPPPV